MRCELIRIKPHYYKQSEKVQSVKAETRFLVLAHTLLLQGTVKTFHTTVISYGVE